MKTENGVIVLEDLKAFSPYDNEVCYTGYAVWEGNN